MFSAHEGPTQGRPGVYRKADTNVTVRCFGGREGDRPKAVKENFDRLRVLFSGGRFPKKKKKNANVR